MCFTNYVMILIQTEENLDYFQINPLQLIIRNTVTSDIVTHTIIKTNEVILQYQSKHIFVSLTV